MTGVEKVENGISILLGSAGAVAVNWDVDVIINSIVTAAIVGIVGGFCGLLGKWIFKRIFKSKKLGK